MWISADLADAQLPDWLPDKTRNYLDHVIGGQPMRRIADATDRHASTILRQIRRVEQERDDPLFDAAIEALCAALPKPANDPNARGPMSPMKREKPEDREAEIGREARRILRRLVECGAFLAVAPAMEKAVVFRETVPGKPVRIAVAGREIAQEFALREWIARVRDGRVASYEITQIGRLALKRMLAEDRNRRESDRVFAHQSPGFAEQHREWGSRRIGGGDGSETRVNLAESPITLLARKKGPDGQAFLSADHLSAGERLREDFELAQMGPRITQNWDRFLTIGSQAGRAPDGPARGPAAARARVAAAVADLGPGLADIAMRCCCFLEGLESAEKRLGWSARSGKVVLRIALTRLKQHYERVHGAGGALIG